MFNPFKPIAIAILPTFEKSDYFLSFKFLISPFKYFDKKSEEALKEKLKRYFDVSHVFLFESGRTALAVLLKALDKDSQDEILIQAFTCVAVPNAVKWAGYKPVYVDIDESLNLSAIDLERKITEKSKAVIIQHSFGYPADIKAIEKICEKHNLVLIEDQAHGLGNSYEEKKLGTFGAASILSFGHDKVISGICGGAIITKDDDFSKKIEEIVASLPKHSFFWVFRQLLYPLEMFIVLQTYSFFNLGKFIHFLINRLKISPRVITKDEKLGKNTSEFFAGLPGALSCLVNQQLGKLDNYVLKRKKIAKFYADTFGDSFSDSSSYLRYNIFVDDPSGLRKFSAKKGVFLGNWYDQVIAPFDIDLVNTGYVVGSCPFAEEKSKRIVNLPTNPNISLSDARRVVRVINDWKSKHDN